MPPESSEDEPQVGAVLSADLAGFAARSQQLELASRGIFIAVLSVAAVALLRWLLHPVLQEGIPYTLFLASVALSTHRAGVRYGVLAALLSVLVGTHLFALPDGNLRDVAAARLVVTVIVFLATSFLVMRIISREVAAKRLLEHREAMLRKSMAERAALAAQLEEARKMESLGRLAGGIAHDFNNLTTVILGSAELLKPQLPADPLLDAISLAATRASEITKQLLGLGRRQMMVLQAMSINGVVDETAQLCARLLPESVKLEIDLEEHPWAVRADSALLQQILLNLVTNARDAMPGGGVVRVEAKNVSLDAAFAMTHVNVKPGDYVQLRVSDSGIGMSKEVQERVFEPFFTAKLSGTGLGLAVVYGLVMQLGGAIYLESEPGMGTSFEIYLPRTGEAAHEAAPRVTSPKDGPHLRVLLAEDHPLVRGILERMLVGMGHQCLVSEDGQGALALASGQQAPEVLVTDVGMPDMDGYRLAELMRARYPTIGVVLISGYHDSPRLDRTQTKFGYVFLSKPFTAGELGEAVQRAREEGASRMRGFAQRLGLRA